MGYGNVIVFDESSREAWGEWFFVTKKADELTHLDFFHIITK